MVRDLYRARGTEEDKDDSDDCEDEGGEGDKATLGPLDLCTAEKREQLGALGLSFRWLPILGRGERAEQHEDACKPEEWKH
jgi:hypothetical protein